MEVGVSSSSTIVELRFTASELPTFLTSITFFLRYSCSGPACFKGYFAYGQVSGKFFSLKYPKCYIEDYEVQKLNNGVCDGGRLNTIACGFDDGDCITFNLGKYITIHR